MQDANTTPTAAAISPPSVGVREEQQVLSSDVQKSRPSAAEAYLISECFNLPDQRFGPVGIFLWLAEQAFTDFASKSTPNPDTNPPEPKEPGSLQWLSDAKLPFVAGVVVQDTDNMADANNSPAATAVSFAATAAALTADLGTHCGNIVQGMSLLLLCNLPMQ